jgi:hypothetical protein
MKTIESLFSNNWIKLQQESTLVESCLTQGLTALGKMEIGNKGSFYAAFFPLSVGLERLMKITLIIDHMAKNKLAPPSPKSVRDYGHLLLKLFDGVKALPIKTDPHPFVEVGDDTVPYEILSFLDKFADSTRYFNLDSLTKPMTGDDPLQDWQQVMGLVIGESLSEAKIKGIIGQSALFEQEVAPRAIINVTHGMDGKVLSVGEQMAIERLYAAAAPYAVYYVLQLITAIRRVLEEVYDAAAETDRKHGNGIANIPHMTDFLQFTRYKRADVLKKKKWP